MPLDSCPRTPMFGLGPWKRTGLASSHVRIGVRFLPGETAKLASSIGDAQVLLVQEWHSFESKRDDDGVPLLDR